MLPMDEPQKTPLSRVEMRRRWPSATTRERRDMMRRVLASERSTPEGAARDRRWKMMVYGAAGLTVIGAFVYQLFTR
jgi:hypothetical protein